MAFGVFFDPAFIPSNSDPDNTGPRYAAVDALEHRSYVFVFFVATSACCYLFIMSDSERGLTPPAVCLIFPIAKFLIT